MEIIFLIVGAILGVILTIVVSELEVDKAIQNLIRKLKIPRKTLSGISHHLTVGNLTITDWEILDGLFPQGIKLKPSVEQTRVTLPKDLVEIRKNIERDIEEKRSQGLPVPYNGKQYALVGCKFHRVDDRLETPTCYLKFKYSDYYNFLATSNSLDIFVPGESITVRQKYYNDINPTDIKHDYLYHSFGVNLAVITKDLRLLFVKRGHGVDILAGVFNSSMNEGLSRDLDQDANRNIDIDHTARRGLLEELGIVDEEIESISMTSVGFSRKWCQHGVLGHAILKINFHDFEKRLVVSKDASFEIDCLHTTSKTGEQKTEYSIFGIPFKPNALADFLEEKKIRITSWGLSCFVLSFLATRCFSLSNLNRAFSSDYWKDTSFIV